MSWLLTYNGLQQSFSDWGLSNLRRTRVSQAQDTVSFTCPGPCDAAELFPYGSIITIAYQPDAGGDAVPWFYGRVIKIPRSGSGSEESMDYELAGPWWYLDNLVYQQEWKTGSPPVSTWKSRVILGQTVAGARRNSGQVITEVLNFAIASGAPIAIGTIEPSLNIPLDEQVDITCAEAIRRMLRWSPDAVAWFDYSTSPYPTFHCKRRSALSALSVPISSISNPQSSISNLSVIPRPDLQVPAVVLKFEQTNTVNGMDYESVTIDKWPGAATGLEFGALTATLQLAGFIANYVTQKIVAVSPYTPGLSSNLYADEDFWRTHDPSIADKDVFDELSFLSGSADPIYPYELIEGQVQDWMTGKHAVNYTVTAVCLVGINDAEGNRVKEEWRTLSCEIIVTDATTGTYTTLSSLVTGEAIPTGLAKAIYDSLNPLQYEGSVTLTEEECGGTVAAALRASSGFVLNLTGGLAAWSSMNALIQQIEEDVDSGRTTISFGPAEQLSPQDLVEFLRANRGRGVAISYEKRTTGESASGASTIALSGPTPLLNTAGAGGQTKLLVISDDTRKITLDPSLISAANKWKVITITSETEAGFDWIHAHA